MTTQRRGDPRSAADWLLTAFGTLVLANAGIAVVRTHSTGLDAVFSVTLFIVLLATAAALRRDKRWAWWLALALSTAALFFVLPVAGTILLGGSLEPVGTGWDVVFFPGASLILVALVTVLVKLRRG